MRKAKRISALLFAFLLAVSIAGGTVTGYAAEPEGYVVMSVEKLTLGQGFILEPQRVPYYAGENLAQVLARALESIGREYEYTGALTDGFYLSAVEDENRASIATTIPSYIMEMWASAKAADPNTKDIAYSDDRDPSMLGEFDYFIQSGWMYSVNNSFPPVGASLASAADGLVVRWQFSLIGLGGDLGGGGTTAAGNVSHMNRSELYTVLASVRADEHLMADTSVRAAYDAALALSRDITLEKESVQEYIDVMKKALGDNQISELSLPSGENGSRTYPYGTTLETALQGLPSYLFATIDGNSKIITGVTWTLDSDFGAPGSYQLRPVLPESYARFTLTAELPMLAVTIQPPGGDMNGDTLLDVRDVSRLAASAGRTDRPLCDMDGSGTVAWNDFRLLLNMLGGDALSAPDSPEITPELDFDKESYAAGDTAAVTVSVPGTGFDTASVSLTYDSTALALQSISLAEPLLETAVQRSEGSLCFGGASLEGAVTGDIATLRFTVLTDGTPETAISSASAALLSSGYYQSAAGSISLLPLDAGPEAVLYGDLNGDGTVDVTDAALLIRCCNGQITLDETQLAASDLNGDGEVTLADAALLVQYCNGIIDSLPASMNENQYEEEKP